MAPKKAKEKEKEVPLQLPIGVQLPLQPILAACSSLEDVGKWACVSRETRDLVETSDAIWRETAKRMDACGTRVNQGFADKAFLLSAKNLEDTFRRRKVTYKFSPVDVVELALKKHGGAAGITLARKKRTARKRKFEEEERTSELLAAFRDLDPTLEFRRDSQLCSNFIHSGIGNPDEIAREEKNRRQREEEQIENRRQRKEEQIENRRQREEERRSQLEAAFRNLDPTLKLETWRQLCYRFIRLGIGNPDEIAREEKNRRQREEEQREKQRKLEEERRSELEAAFMNLDPTLEIRRDSKLCSKFIHSGIGNPDEIAREEKDLRQREEEQRKLEEERRSQLEAAFRNLDPTLKLKTRRREWSKFIHSGIGNPDEIARGEFQIRWFRSTEGFHKEWDDYVQRWAGAEDYYSDEEALKDEKKHDWEDLKRRVVKRYVQRGRRDEIPSIVQEAYPCQAKVKRKNKKRKASST